MREERLNLFCVPQEVGADDGDVWVDVSDPGGAFERLRLRTTVDVARACAASLYQPITVDATVRYDGDRPFGGIMYARHGRDLRQGGMP